MMSYDVFHTLTQILRWLDNGKIMVISSLVLGILSGFLNVFQLWLRAKTTRDAQKRVFQRLIQAALGWKQSPHVSQNVDRSRPPALGEFLICLVVAPEKQAEKLGDFEERFRMHWLPKYKVRLAQLIYFVHALSCAAHLIKGAVFAAIFDKILGLISLK